MPMEKIIKEEFLEKLGDIPLSDDELENISGGENIGWACILECSAKRSRYAMMLCLEKCRF